MSQKQLYSSFRAKQSVKNQVEDILLSINHRISLIEQNLQAKIDRGEYLALCQNKVTHAQLNGIMKGLRQQILTEKQMREQKQLRNKEENEEKISKLMSKLSTKPNKKKNCKQELARRVHSPKIIKPQQMYLESNQTMFNLVIDQINILKNSQETLETELHKRNKTTLNLHNQVCHKIQKLQLELQKLECEKNFVNQWSEVEEERQKPTKHHLSTKVMRQITSDKTVNYIRQKNESNQSPYQSTPQRSQQPPVYDHFLHLFQSIQKQLIKKINIKDVVPLIEKNLQKFSVQISGLKDYMDNSFETTKKILIQQSQINEQLSSISKIGCWSSFGGQSLEGFVKWERQIANIVPQVFEFEVGEDEVRILQQGNYIVKFYPLQNCQKPEWMMVNGEEIQIDSSQIILKINEKNSSLKLTACEGELVIMIQKL